MSVRNLWVDANNDLDPAKAKANAITAAYFDIRDPRVTLNYLKAVLAEGFAPGVYAAWNWPEIPYDPPYIGTLKGRIFATWLSAELERIAPGTPPDLPAVCIDIETHDVPFIVGCLQQWRKHRPHRMTDWTLENHQGGLFKPADVLHITAAVRYTVPQCYEGANMRPVSSLESARDLAAAGFPWPFLVGFYDAAALPDWWQGYAFTQGRLP